MPSNRKNKTTKRNAMPQQKFAIFEMVGEFVLKLVDLTTSRTYGAIAEYVEGPTAMPVEEPESL